jgi:hypothetical protein
MEWGAIAIEVNSVPCEGIPPPINIVSIKFKLIAWNSFSSMLCKFWILSVESTELMGICSF